MKNKTLHTSILSFEKGIEFKIGKEKKILSWKSIFKLRDSLSEHCDWYENWYPYVNYYKNWNEQSVGKYLDKMEEKKSQNIEYSLGGNYSIFLRTKSGIMCDNHKAADIIKREYKKEYGKESVNKLIFDSEMSHCYIYTKDREEAKRFLWWIYQKYIKPTIKTILKKYN